jgi:putative phosphoesterase
VPAVAVLYDIHGNLPALDAVLRDVESTGAGEIVLGGDYALFGPFPAETVARLRDLEQARWIRGNVDRWTARPEQAPDDDLIREAIEACRGAMDPRVVEQLGALDEQIVDGDTRYCHASPISDMRPFLPDPVPDEDELLEGVDQRRVVFGHTHLQFERTRPDGVQLLNPGSVGMPMDGDVRAAYAVFGEDGSVQLRRVEYDNERAAAAMAERFGDAGWAARTAERLRTGQP